MLPPASIPFPVPREIDAGGSVNEEKQIERLKDLNGSPDSRQST